MKKLCIASCTALLMFACGGNTTTNTTGMTTLENGEMMIRFEEGAANGNFTSRLDSLGDQKTFIFEAKEGQTIVATVVTTDSSQAPNVRFNQIISPSGEAEGPFGNEMTYVLNEAGQWKFIIGESLMAGEPYAGEFTLAVEVK